MASQAPFGTDLQRDFDIELRGGKLVQVPSSKMPKAKAKAPREGMSTTDPEPTVNEKRSCGNGHWTDLGKNDAGGMKLPSITNNAVTQAPFGTDLQQDFDVKVMGGKLVQIQNSKARKSREGVGRKGLAVNEGFHENKRWLQKSSDLPSITNNTPTATSYHGYHNGVYVKQKSRKGTDLAAVAMRKKYEKLTGILNAAMTDTHNKARALEDTLQSCTRLDSRRSGVLDGDEVLRAFRSHRVNFTKTDLSKVAEMVGCSLGSEHIAYRKLCAMLLGLLSGKDFNLEEALRKDTQTSTPCASRETHSPASVEDYDVYMPYHLPYTVKQSTAATCNPSILNSKRVRQTYTQPQRLSRTPKQARHLPPIRLMQTYPVASHRTAEASQDVQTHSSSRARYSEGIQCLERALLACSDSDGKKFYHAGTHEYPRCSWTPSTVK